MQRSRDCERKYGLYARDADAFAAPVHPIGKAVTTREQSQAVHQVAVSATESRSIGQRCAIKNSKIDSILASLLSKRVPMKVVESITKSNKGNSANESPKAMLTMSSAKLNKPMYLP